MLPIHQLAPHLPQAINNNTDLLVPVIGSLFDMPLPEDLQQEVSELAQEALEIVPEEDIPIITRTLLKMVDSMSNPIEAIDEIRRQVRGVNFLMHSHSPASVRFCC